MREDPIISGAWIKAALVLLVAGGLGVGGYLLASGTDIDLPDIDLNTTTGTTTNLENTTVEETTVGGPGATTTATKPESPPRVPATPEPPSIKQLQDLNRCIESAGGDIDKITACFDRFR